MEAATLRQPSDKRATTEPELPFLQQPASVEEVGIDFGQLADLCVKTIYFAGRPSAEAQQLSELLPLRYAELKDAALAVSRAKVGLNTIESVRHEESDGTGTLRAWELWALRRRAFIQIVRDYNRRITRYSELATPGQLPAERLISMLILRNDAGTAAPTSNPASSSNDQRNGAGQSAPRTFSGGWSPAAARSMSGTTRDDAVEPASGELENSPPRRERSLLVKPR